MAHWAFGGGWLMQQGTLDFAGGVPVEMGSGFSALAAALVVGARKDYGRQALLPHNAVYVLVGAGLLWFGWFGFNGGSGFSTGDASVLAFVNTLLCPACTLIVWFALDLDPRAQGHRHRRRHRDHRRVRRHHAGGRLRQPRVGDGARRAGRPPELRRHRVAHAHAGGRDARRARRPRHRGVHRESCSSASSPQESWNGVSDGLFFGNPEQLLDQAVAALAAPAYAFVATYVLLRLIGAVMPLRATEHEEALGMDVVAHGEEAYVSGEGAILIRDQTIEEQVLADRL